MAHRIGFFSLIFLLNIFQPFECNDSEATTLSTISSVSHLNTSTRNSSLTKNDNGTMYDVPRNESSSTIAMKKPPPSLEEGKSSIKQSSSTSTMKFRGKPWEEQAMEYVKNGNGTMYDVLRNESSSRIALKKSPPSLEEGKSSIKQSSSTSTMKSRGKPWEEQAMEYVKNGTDAEAGRQVSVIIEESIQNSVLEPWNRVKRDEENDGYPEVSNSNECPQENDDTNEEPIANSFQNNNDGSVQEETDDTSNENSNEVASSQADAAETGGMDVDDRDERNARFSEPLEESETGLYPSWYREPSFGNRYWSSYERESSHNFIKIPIFPGK